MLIKGKLKNDATIDGKSYKAGETVSIPSQYGLEDLLEEIKKDEVKSNDYIKTNR